jgi:hypothetical protein
MAQVIVHRERDQKASFDELFGMLDYNGEEGDEGDAAE